MLNSLRKHATGWVAKLLFGVLILSFAVWGIGDIFTGSGQSTVVAKVAGQEVLTQEVLDEFDAQFRELQEQTGGQLDRRAAVSFGLLNQAVQAAVARRLVDAHAQAMGVTVDDPAVAAAIRAQPMLQGAGGFDRERFELFLQSAGMDEAAYVASVRHDLQRRRLVESLSEGLTASTTEAQRLHAYRNERRKGRVLIVKTEGIEIPAPTEEALQAYLEANAGSHQAPEYRNVAAIVVKPEDLAGEIAVDEAEVRQLYDSRPQQFRTPEQRKVEQLLASSEAAARRAYDRVKPGEAPGAVGQALSAEGVRHSSLGPLARTDLPSPVNEAVFALAEGGVSEPVKTPFGWHVMQVTSITPEKVEPFEAAKAGLSRELALQKAAEQLPDLTTQLDDEIAAGTSLPDAAAKLGLPLLQLAQIDRNGHDAANEAQAPDRLTPEILEAIFTAEAGETSLLNQAQDGRYFVFHVNAVEPARPRRLEEVRAEVEAAWRQDERAKKAREIAEGLRGRATGAGDLAGLAQETPGSEVREVGPLRRDAQGYQELLSPAAVAALFATAPGAIAGSVVEVPEGSAVLGTVEIVPAPDDPAAVAALRTSIADTMKGDLLVQYEAALRERFTVEVNGEVLARLMEQESQ